MAISKEAPTTTPFEKLSQNLNFRNESQHAWWNKTGSMLAKVLVTANYSLEEQHQYLAFYAQVLLPRLGPYPQEFRSSITRSGLPLELSINYQQYGKKPAVRIGFEPLNALSGTGKDPFNKIPAMDLVATLLKLQLSDFDLQIWDIVTEDHIVNEVEEASIQGTKIDGGYIRSQTAFGFDLLGDGNISPKGYTFPALKCQLVGKPIAAVIADSVKRLQPLVDCSQAFSLVQSYLEETTYDDRSFFSWDFVTPSKSRLKIYTGSNTVTWAKLEEVWTLGGRLTSITTRKGLQYLQQLSNLIKINEGERTIEVAFDDRKDTSKATPLLWNYEMRGGDPYPLAKIYFPVHGENDMRVITGVAQFFRVIGLDELGKSYVETVKSY
ncbi:hypothetical protein FQN57_007092 [Myotisia sp. PD_48]|nr:hypothetical protein FQN57_007092 [Myotisia sp. PD_48]